MKKKKKQSGGNLKKGQWKILLSDKVPQNKTGPVLVEKKILSSHAFEIKRKEKLRYIALNNIGEVLSKAQLSFRSNNNNEGAMHVLIFGQSFIFDLPKKQWDDIDIEDKITFES